MHRLRHAKSFYNSIIPYSSCKKMVWYHYLPCEYLSELVPNFVSLTTLHAETEVLLIHPANLSTCVVAIPSPLSPPIPSGLSFINRMYGRYQGVKRQLQEEKETIRIMQTQGQPLIPVFD
jgi:hypothetical protein